MRILDLFSGTHSVGKVARALGHEVLSLDLSGADINMDVLDWDYTTYPIGRFDFIWASPPCQYFSCARRSNIGRYGITRESIETDIMEKGLPLVCKTEEIIDYFQPTHYVIENPATGRMKEFMSKPSYVVDYCKYGASYRKRTQLWSNLKGFHPKLCDKQCGSFVDGRHISNAVGGSTKQKGQGSGSQKDTRYQIPPRLIEELLLIVSISQANETTQLQSVCS